MYSIYMDKAFKEWLHLVTHVILAMIQALLSMEKADDNYASVRMRKRGIR